MLQWSGRSCLRILDVGFEALATSRYIGEHVEFATAKIGSRVYSQRDRLVVSIRVSGSYTDKRRRSCKSAAHSERRKLLSLGRTR